LIEERIQRSSLVEFDQRAKKYRSALRVLLIYGDIVMGSLSILYNGLHLVRWSLVAQEFATWDKKYIIHQLRCGDKRSVFSLQLASFLFMCFTF